MASILGKHLDNERKRVKNAVMTSLYGSEKQPKLEFGEDTEELNAFFTAMEQLAPGPVRLLTALLASWQPNALKHEWTLPDGFKSVVKVMQKVKQRIEIDELGGAQMTYEYYENQPVPKDKKNAANVIHSVDGYILRTLIRRCNHDAEAVKLFHEALGKELLIRTLEDRKDPSSIKVHSVAGLRTLRLVELYHRTGIADTRIMDNFHLDNLKLLPRRMLKKLYRTTTLMVNHDPFPIVPIHDEFMVPVTHVDDLRLHYRHIMSELADSNLINAILTDIHADLRLYDEFHWKPSPIPSQIANSDYGIC